MADGKLCYNPDIFRVRNLDEARRIILTNEGLADTDERWRKETPALVAGLCRELNLRKNQLLLDYGCGVGRLARELCALGCSVIGVDISPEMRTMLSSELLNDTGCSQLALMATCSCSVSSAAENLR